MNNFFTLIPNFVNGVHALHAELIGVTIVLAFTGLVIHTVHALVRRDLGGMFPTLVRLALIPVIVIGLEDWGDILVLSVQGVITDMGANGNGSNIFEDYQTAIARKLGSAAAASNAAQAPGRNQLPANENDFGGSVPGTGIQLTHYGYEKPGEANYDSNSANGSGAFPFDTAPGSLIPFRSAALSPDVAQHYNVQPGQEFTAVTADGRSLSLVYADKTADYLTGRIDIYDPQNAFAGSGTEITGFNGGGIVQGQSGLSAFAPNPGGSIGDQIMWAITLALSWVASGLMWLMMIAQKLLYLIEIAISPVFIGFLMIPALSYLARKFFLGLVALILWPFGWAVANLITKFLIDLTVNPSNSTALGAANAVSIATGPLAGLSYLIVISVWVIGSTLMAPVMIGILFGTGGSAAGIIFGATVGAMAAKGASSAGHAATGAAMGMISGQSAAAMESFRPNFARRPRI